MMFAAILSLFLVQVGGPTDPYGVKEYKDFYEKILKNARRGVLVVGIPDKYVGMYLWHCRVESGFGGLADGEYECWRRADGVPVMKPMTFPPDEPPERKAGVAGGPPIRAVLYTLDHQQVYVTLYGVVHRPPSLLVWYERQRGNRQARGKGRQATMSAPITCPDCGPVQVQADVFEHGVGISGECPKCGDRLYFAPPRKPTHRCKVCGCLWERIPDTDPFPGWTLGTHGGKPGPCCDNAPMGQQIEAMGDLT